MATCPDSGLPELILNSVITCPHCGHQRTEAMPEVSCAIFYQCPGCKTTLQPLAGDCCVFCSYGTEPCPAIQRQRHATQATARHSESTEPAAPSLEPERP